MVTIFPTQLVYNGWKSNGNPMIYTTYDSKGNKVSQEKFFLNPLEHEYYDADYKGICNVCGEETTGGIPIKKVLGATYLDWGIHKGLEQGTHICPACAFCFLLNTKQGRNVIFRYNIVATNDKLKLCNRLEMRDWLINPPNPPFVMAITVSQKKHIVTKSKVSYSRDKFFCNLEEITYNVDREEITNLIQKAELLRGMGINKVELETGNLQNSQFTKLGIKICSKVIMLLSELKKSQLWKIAVFVAGINKDEEEIKCFLDS